MKAETERFQTAPVSLKTDKYSVRYGGFLVMGVFLWRGISPQKDVIFSDYVSPCDFFFCDDEYVMSKGTGFDVVFGSLTTLFNQNII